VDPKYPALAGYRRVRDALRKRPDKVDPPLQAFVSELKQKEYHYLTSDRSHYLVLTDLPGQTYDNDVRKRANQMEDALERLHYWFAIHPKLPAPALPAEQQVVVVTRTANEFWAKHAQWG